MPFSSRSEVQNAEVVQDSDVINHNLDNEGDNLSATSAAQTLGKFARNLFGLLKVIGEKNRRHGAQKFNGADVNLAGTITSVSTAVTGSGAAFLTELAIGDFIAGTANEYREILSISDNNNLTLVSAFSTDISVGQSYARLKTLSERLDSIALPAGYHDIKLLKNSTNPPTVQAGVIEVNDGSIELTSNQALTFASNNFGAPTSDTNNWYYVLANPIGTFTTHIATGSSIIGSLVISSITNPGGSTFRYNFSGSPSLAGVSIGDIVHVTGADAAANDGVFEITGVSDPSDYIEVNNTSGVLQAGAGGTGEALFPVGDIPGGGTSVKTFSPSPTFNSTFNGYYSSFLATSRVVGTFYVDGASSVPHIIIYGHGRNKKDNFFAAKAFISYGSTDTKIVRYASVLKNWGDGYIYSSSAANASVWTFSRSGRVSISGYQSSPANVAAFCGITLNSTQLTTDVGNDTSNDQTVFGQCKSDAESETTFSISLHVSPGDIIRVHSAGFSVGVGRVGVHFEFRED